MKLPADLVARLGLHYKGRPVCVTGGAGFIGGHLIDALLSLGASITVIDDLSNSSLDHLDELIDLEPQRIRFIHGSILDEASVADAVPGAQVIFHLAAIGSVPLSLDQPERSWEVNAGGTVRVLEAARRHGVRRFVNSSSSSVYGDGNHVPGAASPGQTSPKVETQSPAPLSPYAASKIAAELAVRAWSRSFGISSLSLRYFNVFGPRQRADSPYSAVIAAFARRLLSGQPPVIFGDGQQSRDFTPVASVVAANLLAGVCQRACEGQPVNVGSGRRTDLLSLAALMSKKAGMSHLQPRFEPERAGDVRHSLADISAARALLDYAPVGSLDDSLDETIAWYRRLYVASEQ